MRARSLVVMALMLVCLSGMVLAQGDELPLSNWGAPPYWNPAVQPRAKGEPVAGLIAHAQGMQAQAEALPSSPLALVAIAPCRIVDTRMAASDGFHQPNFADDEARTFDFPSSPDCTGLPATAGAYSVNIQFRPISQLAFLTAYPTGTTRPGVSTLTAGPAAWVQNAAIVPAGTSGAIDIYCQYAGRVVIDINGYYGTAGAAGAGGTWLTGGAIGGDYYWGGYIGIGVTGWWGYESCAWALSPITGTIDNFTVYKQSSCSFPTFTLRVNGANTVLTCTFASGGCGESLVCTDTTHSVAVTVGDLISVYTPLCATGVGNAWWRARLK